ncbi:MAG: class I SAM-dependent methyltransferase, partial [Bosea sp. (in: a-proteobacteria)]
ALGTGTGLFAREMARRGATGTGHDPSPDLLAQAEAANTDEPRPITYLRATAEETGLLSSSFDIITAATCWHWFDRPKAAAEAARLLAPVGTLVICHLD